MKRFNLLYLRQKLPFLFGIYLYIKHKQDKEKLIGEIKSFGNENPDKTFLLIKLNNPILGLMAIQSNVLGYLRIAYNKGYIPVVDLKNHKNGYLETAEIGNINAWEYYFEQPTRYTLDDVYKSKNVITTSGEATLEAYPLRFHFLMNQKSSAAYYFKLLNSFVRIKDSVLHKINQECNSIIGGKRVIGVVNRGSDYINTKGHAIQPTVGDLIIKIKELLLMWGCEYIFLATEEEYVLELFKNSFNDKLLVNKCCRINSFDKYIFYTDVRFNRENDLYYKGLEYLTSVVILSRCNCLVGSMIVAVSGALVMNQGKYENKYIYDLGVYK
jgi:hypothetical protein